jgi:hypothetical protein
MLMILIAIIAVCLGVYRLAPGLGILLTILMVPALARTIASVAQRQAVGRAMFWEEKAFAFIGSLVIVALIGLAASFAFVVTCSATFYGGGAGLENLQMSILIGVVGAGIAFLYLFRRLWP